MKARAIFAAAGFLVFLNGMGTPAFAAPKFKKVMIVVLENTDFDEAAKQADLAAFAQGGALLTGFHAEAHPSQPNYVALSSGSMHGVSSNDLVDLDVSHLGNLLEAKRKSWKAYLEDYPGGCFAGERHGNYVRKHNPFISFADVRKSPERCAKLVSAETLRDDIASKKLPDFSLYIPNLKNDGHDTGVDFAGRWFSKKFLPMLRGASGALPPDLVLVVTFDESKSRAPNWIYTALVGAEVKPGARSATPYNHYSLLRTIENEFGLGTLGVNDEKAAAIEDVWK